MADVNLLRNTENPEEEKPKTPLPPQFEVTDPNAGPGGLSRFFKSLRNRPKLGTSETSQMGLGKAKTGQRILNEKKSGRPAVIPLPEEEAGGVGVNLLSEEIYNRDKPRQQLIKLGFIALGAVAVVGLAVVGLVIAQRSVKTQIVDTQNQLQQVKSQINGLKSDQQLISDSVQKVNAIRGLIDRHVQWTNFFSQLEKYTLRDVTYGTSFIGDIGGNLTLGATTNSFPNVAKQYLLLEQAVTNHELISTFGITGVTRASTDQGDKISFAITMTVLPEAFIPPAAKENGSTTPTTGSPTNTNTGTPVNANVSDLSNTNTSQP